MWAGDHLGGRLQGDQPPRRPVRLSRHIPRSSSSPAAGARASTSPPLPSTPTSVDWWRSVSRPPLFSMPHPPALASGQRTWPRRFGSPTRRQPPATSSCSRPVGPASTCSTRTPIVARCSPTRCVRSIRRPRAARQPGGADDRQCHIDRPGEGGGARQSAAFGGQHQAASGHHRRRRRAHRRRSGRHALGVVGGRAGAGAGRPLLLQTTGDWGGDRRGGAGGDIAHPLPGLPAISPGRSSS